jgi:hypothetical protein
VRQTNEKKAFIPQLIFEGDREGETREKKVVILNQNRKKIIIINVVD